ncbi:MAG: hypothetical protein IKS98_07500 [Lachnospiraceae bacterium]|nr:hypothetical protein [Lachnospiraceae bacterium]
MRFFEDTNAYYFSTFPNTDVDERDAVIENSKDYVKDYVKTTFGPEDTVGGTVKKYIPIAIFVIAVILLIIFSINKMVAGILFTFGGVFVLFGIAALLPGEPDPNQIELPHQGKIPKGIISAVAIMIGLAVIIPAILAPSLGYAKASIIGGGAWFVTAGLFFIVYIIYGIMRYSKAKKNSVQAKCIGYIKMIESGNSDGHHQRLFITGTPVFEYQIHGIDYKAFQEDNMRTGTLTPLVGDVVELGVLPEDPYAVFYHKNTGAKIFAVVLSVIAIAAGVFLFCMVPNVNDNGGFIVNTMGGQTRLAKAKFDDKTIAKYISGDYTIEYVKVTGVHESNGMPAVDLSNGRGLILQENEKDKYPVGTELYVVYPVDGSACLNLRAEEWEYAGTREVKGLQ